MAASAGYFGQFTPNNVDLGGAPASLRTFGSILSGAARYPVIWFPKDDGVNGASPVAFWSFIIPGPATQGYSGTTGLTVVLKWFCPTGVVTGNCQWAVAFDLKGATDLPVYGTDNAPAFGGTNEVTAATAVGSTAGAIVYTSLPVTIAKIQNGQTTAPAINDFARLRVRRKVENATDTLSAPVCLVHASLLDY